MALTKVSDAGLSTPASDLQDSEKIVLGTGNDLEIYHDGTDSHFNNSTGDVKVDADFRFADSKKLKFGGGQDLQVYHDGSNTHIDDTGTGQIQVHTNELIVMNPSGGTNETILKGTANGAVELRYDNGMKFKTTVTGTNHPDGSRMGCGDDDDFYMIHTSDVNILRGTDKVTYIQSDGNILITKNNGTETLAKFVPDGGVELYYDNVKKLETTAAGGTLTGTWTGAGSSGPAFRATINASTNQGLAGDTAATVEFDEETFDTDSCFDTTTHKFTPNKAGYYQVNYHVGFSASNNATSAWVYLQKNDAAYSQISQSNDWCYHMDMTSSDLVYLNGSSDSIRLRALHNSSGDTFTLFDGTTGGCYFSAVWIRA